MRTNPYPEEPTHAQPTDVLPPPRMEGLQQRAVQSPPPVNEPDQEADSAEIRLEEARTVRYAIGKLSDFLQWFMVVLEVMLAIRVFFKFIQASQFNLFAGLLYALTDIVLFPFHGIVRNVPEWFAADALIAMLIYWLLFIAIRRFLHILITAPEEAAS
jgi:hypothetical protein